MTVTEIEDVIHRELLEGMDGTDIRAGFIGELGTSGTQITPSEEKVLVAAAHVQSETKVPIMVHTEGVRDTVLSALTLLEREGADIEKVHICHVNRAPVVEGRGQPGSDDRPRLLRLDLRDRLRDP